jgi:SAM-dependent methyltransferase
MRPRIARSEGRHLFGHDPETYDRYRPGHPTEVYEMLRERCGLRAGAKALEVGPGTGQASRRLLEYGADPLVGIEPDPRLREFLRHSLGSRIELVEATLEEAQLDADFDLAAAASSFHWVEEAAGLTKLHQALRPGGWVALWWTSFGDEQERDAFMEAVDPLFETVPRGPAAPSEGRPSFARDAEHRLAALAHVGFEHRAHDEVRWTRKWDTVGISGLYSTYSPISSLDGVRRDELLESVRRIAETQFGGRIVRTLITSLYTARKPS